MTVLRLFRMLLADSELNLARLFRAGFLSGFDFVVSVHGFLRHILVHVQSFNLSCDLIIVNGLLISVIGFRDIFVLHWCRW